ncbi:hypothetical protein GCM10027454_32050 [Algoriphagus aestuariicola]
MVILTILGFACVENNETPEINRVSNIADLQNYVSKNFRFSELDETTLSWSSAILKDSLEKTFFDIPFGQSYDSSDLAYIFRLTGEMKNSEVLSSQIVRMQTFDQDLSFRDLEGENAHENFNGIKIFYSIIGEFAYYEIYKDGVSAQVGTDIQSKATENSKGFGYENFNMPVGDCGQITNKHCERVCYYFMSGAAKKYFACSTWECSSTVVDACPGGGGSGGGSGSNSYSTDEKANFKYPPGSNYETEYTKLTEYIKNKIPLLKTNSTIINAIQGITGLTVEEIQQDFEWGEGPTIWVEQLDNYAPNTSSNTLALFDPTHPNRLFIDEDLVMELETGSSIMNSDALIFLIGVSILHEYVHYGDFNQGVYNEIEEGNLFEESVYGTRITRSNAGDFILKR